MLVMLTVC